jgi:hypothetical protein
MTDVTMTDADLRAIAEAATPGPWNAYDNRDLNDAVWIGTEMFHTHAEARRGSDDVPDRVLEDGAFIAAFNPQTVLALLARVEAAEEKARVAIVEMSKWAREAGEASVRLAMSEAAGIVDGWRERAEAAEAQRDALKAAAKPFIEAAKTIRPDDADLSIWRPAIVQVKHYRALAALTTNKETQDDR